MNNSSKPPNIILKFLWEIITVVLPAVLIALFVNVYVVEAVEIDLGSSMEPNMYVGHRVMTEKISYRFRLPERGEIVVADQKDIAAGLIKRVVALPGEVVAVQGGHTYINGEKLDEPWVTHFGGSEYEAALVPEGHFFILGDNRVASRDSRIIGPIHLEDVSRRAWLIYWPLGEFEFIP